jgi:hypothetical protein
MEVNAPTWRNMYNTNHTNALHNKINFSAGFEQPFFMFVDRSSYLSLLLLLFVFYSVFARTY